MRYRFLFFFLPIAVLLSSCLSYYQKNLDFQTKFESGKIQEAEKLLSTIKDKKVRKTLFLQKVNQGVVASLLDKYKESNALFEQAFRIGEDYQMNYANEVGAFLLNPNFVVYKPESHELMMIHYYKAINYLKLGQKEAALVEAKRMNIKLTQMNAKYTSANKLTEDAFAHNLMGIIYQANDDFNNAFIAYRNALHVYEGEYAKFFNIFVPDQLKKDLLRSAYLTGLIDEVKHYEKEFGTTFKPIDYKGKGDVILFWNNGLCPVKDQWSIDFTLVKGTGGYYNFVNQQLGLSFAFYISDLDYQNQGFGNLHLYRVVFPKYVERSLFYTNATLNVSGVTTKLELAQDVSQLAFKSLKDRMVTELGKSLLRFATKKALEAQIRTQNQNVGALVGVFNAMSESADTRNWQTLPHSIYYTRLILPEGTQQASLQTNGDTGNEIVPFTFDVKAGNTSFYTYSSLEYLK